MSQYRIQQPLKKTYDNNNNNKTDDDIIIKKSMDETVRDEFNAFLSLDDSNDDFDINVFINNTNNKRMISQLTSSSSSSMIPTTTRL
jgi:hypothetical protein